MTPIVLMALLQASVPPVSEAEALAAKPDAETLLLKFGAVKQSDYSAADRARLAKVLSRAAEADRKDTAIAISLAERSVALVRSADSLTLLAQLELDLGQRSAATEHLDAALALTPKHVPALLARGDLASEEADFAVAVAFFRRARAAGAKAAGPKLAEAEASLKQKQDEAASLKRAEPSVRAAPTPPALSDEPAPALEKVSGDRVRAQEMSNFVFFYASGNKQGSLFDFERRVERVLDHAYDVVTAKLGVKPAKKTPVMLMTSAEFMGKYLGTPMSQAAGFWDGTGIVINGGAELNPAFAQVMVHELTHTVVSGIVDARRVPRWMNEGLAENVRLSDLGTGGKPTEGDRMLLAALKARGRLPRMQDLEGKLAAMTPDAHVAYIMSALAAYVLIDQRGYTEYLNMLREVADSPSPEPVIERHVMSVERLNQRMLDEIE